MPVDKGYFALANSAARVAWPGLSAYSLEGSDAEEWLQGQVTNDLRKLGRDGSIDACLVKATGQLQAVLRIWRREAGLLIIAEGGEVLADRFENFVILEEIELRTFGPVLTVQGPESGVVMQDLAAQEGEGAVLRSVRTGTDGFDIVGSHFASVLEQQGRVLVDADWDEVQSVTLERRIPLFGEDTDEKTLPPELGRDFDSAFVAYDKGCYTGQEVLQRIHSRGHTNREWAVLSVNREVGKGTVVTDDSGAKVGEVTRCAVSPEHGHLAGAFVRVSAFLPKAKFKIGDADASFYCG